MSSDILNRIMNNESLSLDDAKAMMKAIMSGECSNEMIAGLLASLRTKGETAEEVAGFAQTMQDNAINLQLNDVDAVDGCGTGGDGAHTFNISTGAAIVAAGAGVTVAKHGNRSVSSKCGSADLLEATGGKIDLEPKLVESCINEIGFGFMFAPHFHPAMKYAMPVRKAMGVRTVFNILGPLTNPARVKRQVIGVFDRTLVPLISEVGRLNGLKHLLVVHSDDDLDEFSVAADTEYIELKDGKYSSKSITPEEVGLGRHLPEQLAGGDAAENLKILQSVLDGNQSACRDAVLFNGGAMIYVSGKVSSIADGVKLAAEAIDSGTARALLANWIKQTSGGNAD